MSTKSNSSGFTIVELLIAMTFFSFLLLFVTFGFIQVNRSYTRGIVVKSIQESARTALEDITRNLRINDNVQISSTLVNRLCIGDTRYGWNQHNPGASDHSVYEPTTEKFKSSTELITLVRSNDGAACDALFDKDKTEIILDDRAVVQALEIDNTTNADGVTTVVFVASTGAAAANDLAIFGTNAQCKVQVGDQFCDVVYFDTAITKRK